MPNFVPSSSLPRPNVFPFLPFPSPPSLGGVSRVDRADIKIPARVRPILTVGNPGSVARIRRHGKLHGPLPGSTARWLSQWSRGPHCKPLATSRLSGLRRIACAILKRISIQWTFIHWLIHSDAPLRQCRSTLRLLRLCRRCQSTAITAPSVF